MEATLVADVICDISTDSLHIVETITEKIESKDKSTLHDSLEEGEINTSNKENECLNTSNPISKQNKIESILTVSLEEGELNTSNKENERLNIDSLISEQNKNVSSTKKINLETSMNVLDTSTKEDKNDQRNDNTKLGNSCLMECSVAILNCDTLIQTFKATNENQNDNLHKGNNNVSILDTKGIMCSEKRDHNDSETETNDKNNMDNTTVVENSDVLNTVTQKMLNEEDTVPKQQSLSNDSSNVQIQTTTIREENNLETTNQSTNNTKEINCEIEPEVNVSVISNNTVNIPVNPKENLMDISIEENSCTENAERTEIVKGDNDINESTTHKESHIKQDDVLSSNENQDSTSTCTHNSPTIILQVSDNLSEEPVHSTEQIELHSAECLIDLQSSKPSNSILETNDSSTVAEFHDGAEEDLHDEEGLEMKSSSETPKISKRKSVTELNKSKTEKEAEKDDAQNSDESDNISNVGILFQDISADEWKQKRQILSIEGENNSIHSTSTVKLDNDSETECDLVLVDKEAWLAAENLKTIKDKETFDYDSDDTIVLKSKMDYISDKISNSSKTQILCEDSTQENDNADSSKLLVKKTPDTVNKKTNLDERDVNVSLQNTSKKENSLNKSKEDISNNSKNDLVKSSDKQLEEEVELTPSQKESEDHNKSENKLASPVLDKKEKKNRSLNSSSNKKSKLKKASKKYNSLRISSSDEEDEDNVDDNKAKIKSSEKKRNNKNYSTMVHIGSDSDTCNDSSDSSKSDRKNQSLRIPCFLFKCKNSRGEAEESGESDDEFNGDKSSKESIDSDIDLEYNLGGKTIGKFSDDDIPGDECRASESESSDPDDNGSDLADFVVDDDEVEEEEEDENEDEDDDDDDDDDEDEDENENENEDEDEDKEQEQEQEQQQEQNKELDEKMEDEEITEDKNERKRKDILSSEEKEKDASPKNLNVSNVKSDKKKNQEKTSSETYSAGLAKDEIVVGNKVNTSIKLDTTLSGKKKKNKQKLIENNEVFEESPKSHLNEADAMFTKKTKVANVSLACSTPKTDFHEHEQFKHNISSEKKKRRYIEKTSLNEETEEVRLRNLSTDNSDKNITTSTNSLNGKKRYSMEKNISADSLELVKDINLPKSILSKKAHLNKTMSPSSETPTTKYLKKQKLNDSAPLIKLEETKSTSRNISLSDNTKGISQQDETTPIVSEKIIDALELNSSLTSKRKKSIEASIELDEQKELRHKKLIFKTEQVKELDDKAESHTTSDNEKENSKKNLKVDNGKKKKKNKKNTSFQELDILDMEANNMVEENVNNDEKVKMISNIESKKHNKKNKNKKNVDKCNDKPSLCFSAIQSFKAFQSNDAKNYKKCIEGEGIPSKKKKKVTSEIPSLQVKEHSKKLLGWNVSKGSTSENVEFSNNARENVEFLKSKHEALQAAKRAAESIKANKHLKKTMRTEHVEKMQPKIESTIMATSKRGIKRLSVDIIENLSDIPMRPHKKQKLLQKPVEGISNTTTKNGFTESGITKANKKCIPSNYGGTTEFDVVNLQKAKKQSKKISAIATFRQKMLSRNSRYPVTSYIMYLQKQRALGGDQGFVKQF